MKKNLIPDGKQKHGWKCFRWVFAPTLAIALFQAPESVRATQSFGLQQLVGKQDAVLVADPQGRVVFSKHADKPLVPASILKIFTALVALHHLGPDHRFETEFFLDPRGNLKVKGHGDPLLISEVLKAIAGELGKVLEPQQKRIRDLVLDDAYFSHPIRVPGVFYSNRPHDAPNGALCANFNTFFFKRSDSGFASAEPLTPLLPATLEKIKRSGLDFGRIIYSHDDRENLNYAGELLLHFMKEAGISSFGSIREGKVSGPGDRLVFRYVSQFSLEQIISRMLEYSNNFIANQLLIAAGAKAYGAPGTLEKGVDAALDYADKILPIHHFDFVEGSGISRKNRISAAMMLKILDRFAPHRLLMPRDGRIFCKTGTLSGINTRAGYIEGKAGAPFRFVAMVNTPGKPVKPIMDRITSLIPE